MATSSIPANSAESPQSPAARVPLAERPTAPTHGAARANARRESASPRCVEIVRPVEDPARDAPAAPAETTEGGEPAGTSSRLPRRASQTPTVRPPALRSRSLEAPAPRLLRLVPALPARAPAADFRRTNLAVTLVASGVLAMIVALLAVVHR